MEEKEMSEEQLLSAFGLELEVLEGLHANNPEIGKNILKNAGSGLGKFSKYTNRLFGAPYQLLPSVDVRFNDYNSNVGYEYMKHFLLNSPILHIRPGMPKYTGDYNPTSIKEIARKALVSTQFGVSDGRDVSVTDELIEKLLFGRGKQVQARMFGFRETYLEYMGYVNYMCRSMAIYMGLDRDTGSGYPNGAFVNKHGSETNDQAKTGSGNSGVGFEKFESLRWENYRMTTRYVRSTRELFNAYNSSSGGLLIPIANIANRGILSGIASTVGQLGMNALASPKANNEPLDQDELYKQVKRSSEESGLDQALLKDEGSIGELMSNKVKSVMFMVEPVSFQEQMDNTVGQSMIESLADSIKESVGSELGFITNSHVDTGIIDDLVGFLGDVTSTGAMFIGKVVEPATGGFVQNVFSGAAKSLKGQKMIYPDIYKSSNSQMDYRFSITLSTPYGDKYNYYMNIIVPLMHLIALAAPRMVTSNTVSSPFLVQAYIPGMCTCQLGIVSNMTIEKNPTTKHVSVDGFPLTVKVDFQIKELYNSMAISPAHDPSSFLFNETLNDYMANLAGLIPSLETYMRQQGVMLSQMNDYFKLEEDDGIFHDSMASTVQYSEDLFNPLGR